ncbi:transcription factor MYB106 [Eucalyptus grandis]|uniref:Uncharacterized protein n=2 Tax=Eucalyptus grandis TaxID=71139 RepID=A0ACC3J523_EUCGR|nr:transcription factor MYB106 [Eucalyptus grandis]KAK3409217.1 hypothetical protein EUGRSUZ_J01362 [Eucalyptus grandis]
MGRSPCCDKVGLKKGPWTPEEDQKLLAYIEENGHGSWRALPSKAGLQRCGKSCRLRWTNYLRPDIKRGKFSLQEEQTIIQLHALLGNRWSAIATHLPKRTDNEIKNYWNTHLKKRLAKMGIDPVTHKPKNDALVSSDGQSKSAAKLSHLAQWESARLEAEARLARESKLRSQSFQHHHSSSNSSQVYSAASALASTSAAPPGLVKKATAPLPPSSPQSLDTLKAWTGSSWPSTKSGEGSGGAGGSANGIAGDLESPTSTLTFSEPMNVLCENPKQMIEFVGSSGSSDSGMIKEEGEQEWKGLESSITLPEFKEGMGNNAVSFTSTFPEMTMSLEGPWTPESLRASSVHGNVENNDMEEGFTSLLLNSSGDQSLSDGGGESDKRSDYYEDNKNYWNSILNLVNSSPSESPMF